MAHLADVLTYIFENYPSKNLKSKDPLKGLSPRKIIWLAYLADWKNAILNGRQISDAAWKIMDFEPSLEPESLSDVTLFAERKSRRILTPLRTALIGNGLSRQETGLIDEVISIARNRTPEELKQLVYSTYPALSGDGKDTVDMVELARKYQDIMPQRKLQRSK
ncbi:hypothetical protein VB780_25945 [Leptolyngbya sp. CCNP1308]|uniref:hypothetical protein n=1 Tax=Leptolyngbya sp. CCNP1308 TaxID=3110255 RepID=UPI002B20D61F|nr:hypothetical protein [Leptolyngbya sp. CCNP1308]MEA5452043.1 hypothetical protein [Leptolyngbya sp. CCNP1308]